MYNLKEMGHKLKVSKIQRAELDIEIKRISREV
jgi:hypothetical protein